MSRRPTEDPPIIAISQAQTAEEVRQIIGAASQEELDALKADFDSIDLSIINSEIDQLQSDVVNINNNISALATSTNNSINAINTEIHTTIPIQRLIGNPGSTAVKPAPIDLDDGGLYINESTGKIYVGDTSLNGEILYLSADRSDGKKGTGSLASPLNVSTPDRLDAILKDLYDAKTPANLNFLPHPGILMNGVKLTEVYPSTSSFAPWYFYNGLRWKGFGKGRTVFKPIPNAQLQGDLTKGQWAYFQSSYKWEEVIDQGSIEDCTFDGGVTTYALPGPPTPTYRTAFRLVCLDFEVKNVHFTRLGGRGQEIFPIGFANGVTGLIAGRRCRYLIENCSSKFLYHDGGGAGALIQGPSDNTAFQSSIWRGNHFDDMYICWAWQSNIDIHDNIFRNTTDGMFGNYCNINCDTGINKGIKIRNNYMYGAIASGVAVGAITLGNWLSATLGVKNRDILIEGNTFEGYPNSQNLYTPGVMFVGGNSNWNISNNFYKPSVHTFHYSKRGFVSAKGTGNAAPPTTDGAGFGNSWWGSYDNPPSAREGPEEANSEGIMFNNKLIDINSDGVTYGADDGKTPLGMDNHLMSALV